MTEESRSRRRAGATQRARSFRRGDNIAEARLWNELKDRRLGGYKFVRQFPIGSYFADFANRERCLVIEIDGSQHAESSRDRRRDEFMREKGYSILRFWSGDVLSAIGPVCATILAALDGRLVDDVTAFDMRYVHRKREADE